MLGFPIRTSSDPRSVGSSPRHIAASHVLHRLLMPRHPPCALKHLQHKKPEKEKKKLHIKHTQQHPHQTNPPPKGTSLQPESSCVLDARNHYPQIKHHTPPPKQGDNSNRITGKKPTPPSDSRPTPPSRRREVSLGLLSQSPIVCLAASTPKNRGAKDCLLLHQTRLHYRGRAIQRIAQSRGDPHDVGRLQVSWCSLERR